MRIGYLIVFVAMACRPSNQISELVGVLNERPLEETVWLLKELNGKTIGLVTDQREISVIYHADNNRVSGFGGCNSFMGSFAKDGSTLSATLASTRMFCEGKMDVEAELMKVLSEPSKFEIKGSHLYLKSKGTVVAQFLAEVKTSD